MRRSSIAVRAQAQAAGLLSNEHFTVDGTQLEAWASLKSFQQRDAAPGEPPDDPAPYTTAAWPDYGFLVSELISGRDLHRDSEHSQSAFLCARMGRGAGF